MRPAGYGDAIETGRQALMALSGSVLASLVRVHARRPPVRSRLRRHDGAREGDRESFPSQHDHLQGLGGSARSMMSTEANVSAGLRIGVDGACWPNRRGYGRYTRSLLAALAQLDGAGERYTLFLDEDTSRQCDLPASFERVIVRTAEPPAQAASAQGHRGIGDLVRMTRAVARARPDVFLFPSVYTFFPIVGRARAVVTIHDVIDERHPEMIFPGHDLALLWRMKVGLAVRQAHLIVTVSE